MPLNILISNSSGKPIYDQIAGQMKSLIMAGSLKEGDALPSMRLLAKELRISVITTKRAYEELERDGFICTVAGKGSFVAGKNLEFIKEEQFKKVEEYLTKAVEIAKTGAITRAEVEEIFAMICEEEKL